MDKDIEKKLAGSLTAKTTDLLPYLPYLLQDIWELGSNPKDMIKLIKQHIPYTNQTKVLDLACGKGAVSINVCKELNVTVKGIDIIPEFIKEAVEKSKEYGIEDKCAFEVNDINMSVIQEKNYDIVIIGAIGNVLGNPEETLEKLKKVIKKDGYILIDEAYLDGEQEDIKYDNYEYLTLEQWKAIFTKLDLELVETLNSEDDIDETINEYNNEQIRKRADELIEQYPEKEEMFEGFVQSQLDECSDLEDNLIGVTWILKKKG